MARKRKAEVDFSWTDDELQLLLEASLDFKSKCEFQGESWESKRSKYENILDIMLKQYPEDQERYPNKEKLNKDQVAAKLKTIRTGYRKACDNGWKNDGGRIVFTFYGLCKILWGGSPAVTSLSNAIGSPLQDQLSSTTFVNKFPDDLSPVQPASFEGEEEEFEESVETNTSSEEVTKQREKVSEMLKNRKDKKVTSRIRTDNQLLQLTREDIACKKQMLEKIEKSYNELRNKLANLNQVKCKILVPQYSRVLVSLINYYQTNRGFSCHPHLFIMLDISYQTYMLEISNQTYSRLVPALW